MILPGPAPGSLLVVIGTYLALGALLPMAREWLLKQYPEGSKALLTAELFQLFGDPELRIFTAN